MRKLFALTFSAILMALVSPVIEGAVRAQESVGELKPVAVVSVAGTDELLGDVLYVTEKTGYGDFGRLVTLLASPYTAALDKSKPAGAYVVMSGQQKPAAVAFLPVKDLDLLLATLKEQIGEPEELEGGVLEIGTDRPQPLFVKQQGGWAFVTNQKEQLGNLPADPAKLLGSLPQEYTLAIRANISNLPEALREMAIRQLRKGFEERLAENVDDPRAAELARKVGERWLDETIRLVNETEHVTLGWQIDADGRKTYLDLSVTALANTKLAGEFTTVCESESAFAGFLLPDAALTLHAAGRSADTDVEAAQLLLRMLRDEAMKGIDKDNDLADDQERATAKDIVGRLLDIADQTVAARTVNFGGALVLQPNSMSAAIGGFVADGPALEAALDDLWQFAKKKDPNAPNLEFDTETYEGIKLHTTHVPLKDAKAQARRVLGDPMEVVLGIGDQSVYLAFGKDSTALLKRIIDRSRSADGKFIPAELTVALRPILEFAAAIEDNPGVRTALESLKKTDGNDHVSLKVLPADRGVAVRFEIEEAVLSAAGEVSKALRAGAATRNR